MLQEQLGAIDPSASVSSVASAAKVGELFQYTVGNVSLPPEERDDPGRHRRRAGGAAEHLQPVGPARNPLNAVHAYAQHEWQAPARGPVTVLDAGAYAGDARIDDLRRVRVPLSYGVDQQVIVDATKNRQRRPDRPDRQGRAGGHAQAGIYAGVPQREQRRPRPDPAGWSTRSARWKLQPAKPDETTEQVYRFKGSVPAGKQSKLAVKQEIITAQQIAILPSDIGQLEFFSAPARSQSRSRGRVGKAVAMKYAMVDTQRQIEQRQQRVNEVSQEQNRIRENMKTVASNARSEYYTRLLKKLDEREHDRSSRRRSKGCRRRCGSSRRNWKSTWRG